jgi:hypothetical protein
MSSVFRLTVINKKHQEETQDFSSQGDAIEEFHLFATGGEVILVKVDEYDAQTREHLRRLATEAPHAR